MKFQGNLGLCRFGFVALLLGVAILLADVTGLHAQQTFGRVLGSVQDSSGAAIAGASVAIRNVATGVERITVTGADGYYNDPQVLPGTYTVTATVQGFNPAAIQNVVVNVATDTRVDLKLTVGSVTQNVIVTEAVPQIDTTNSSVGGTVNEQRLTELPLNGRNWTDLTLLQTGITQVRAVLTTAGMQGMTFSAHGADNRSNTYLLDGTLTQNVFANNNSSIINTSLGLDGIQEYKVVTNLPSAEYGLLTGAQTVISSKGGTNVWHGDAYDFMRNRILDARNYFDAVGANGNSLNFPTQRNPPFIRNNFGGAFGGPIKKEKTFVWGVYEGLRVRLGTTNNSTSLPLGCFYDQNNVFHNTVQSTVNNSLSNTAVVAYGNKANCVGTPTVAAANTTTGAGIIYVPPTTQYLASVFPAPNFNQGGTSSNYTFPFTEPSSENMGQIRVDQNFSQNDSLFARYTQDEADQNQNTAYPEMLYELHSASQFLTIGETHTFSPTVLNTLRLGAARTQLVPAYGPNTSPIAAPYLNNALAGQPPPDRLTGFPVTSTYFDIPPSISPGAGNQGTVTGFATAPGPTPFGGKGNVQNVLTLSDDMFWTKGKHSFKFGTLINRFQDSLNYDLFGNGAVSFSNNSAFFGLTDAPPAGSPVGTPGYPVYSQLNWISNGAPAGCSGSSCTIVPQSNQSHSYIYYTYGFYAQDDFRVLPRLTLNLGLRYEITGCLGSISSQPLYVTTLADVASKPTYLPGTNVFGQSSTGLGAKANCATNDPSLHNFSPRIGIAWDVFGNGKTAVRTGGGIYYTAGLWGDLLTYNVVSQPPSSNQIQIFNTVTTKLPGQTTPGTGIQLTLPLDAMDAQLLNPAINTLGVSYSPRFILYDTKQPSLASYQFFIDQKLPWAMALSVGYVGSRGWNLYQSREVNPPNPAGVTSIGVPYYCNPADLTTGQPTTAHPCSATTAIPTPAACIATPSTALCRPNLNIGTMLADVADGESWYNSLQISLQKQISQGLQFQASYTFSKDEDTPNGQSIADSDTAQEVPGNPGNVDKGVSLREIPQVFRMNIIYHVPNLKSQNFAAKLEHGWWMSSIVALQSGQRANLALGITRSLSSNSTSYADRASLDPSFNSGTVVTGNISQWWNPSMFDIPALGTYGTSPRGVLVGPDYKNVDLSIVKDTKMPWLGEAGSIQFRAEFFNLFNRAQFGLPNATLVSLPSGTSTNLPAGQQGVIQWRLPRLRARSPPGHI